MRLRIALRKNQRALGSSLPASTLGSFSSLGFRGTFQDWRVLRRRQWLISFSTWSNPTWSSWLRLHWILSVRKCLILFRFLIHCEWTIGCHSIRLNWWFYLLNLLPFWLLLFLIVIIVIIQRNRRQVMTYVKIRTLRIINLLSGYRLQGAWIMNWIATSWLAFLT